MQFVARPPVRLLAVDGALAAVLGAVLVAGTFGAADPAFGPAQRELDPLTFVLLAVAILGLLVRRVAPLPGLGACVAATTAYLALGYPYGPIVFSVAITIYTVASACPVRVSLPASGLAAVVLAAPVAADWRAPVAAAVALAIWATASLAAWALGTAVRGVRESTRRARVEDLRRTTYEERLRTAQDVHDIVGHGLAAISMQAGVALHVLDRAPAQARELLETIRASSEDALEELRSTLAAFRAPAGDPAGDRTPAPGLDRLAVLVDRTSDAGVPVELVRSGEQVRLPASLETAAYRIVQESLANVLRHAGPATATVRIHTGAAALVVEVSDTGRGPGGAAPVEQAAAGQGLAGMRARAAAVGGRLVAGAGTAGGFTVRAELPVSHTREHR